MDPNREVLLGLLKREHPRFQDLDQMLTENPGLLQDWPEGTANPFHISLSKVGFVDPLIIYLLLEQAEGLLTAPDALGITPVHRLAEAAAHFHYCFANPPALPTPKYNPIDIFIELLDLLTDRFIDLADLVTKEGQTPLHFAVSMARHASADVLSALIDECPRLLSVRDLYGHYPIHKLAAKRFIDVKTIEKFCAEYPQALLEPDLVG